MDKLQQKREELAVKRAALHEVFEEAGSDIDLMRVKSLTGDSAARAAEVKRLNTELTALGEEVEELGQVAKIAADTKAAVDRDKQTAANNGQPEAEQKSFGDLFVNSLAFKGFDGRRGPSSLVRGDFKTLMSTSAGWAPMSIRSRRVVYDEQRAPVLLDYIPMVGTNQAAILYMEETTFTNNAAERAEGANNAGEAALALTERTSNVREIAVWIPVTKEQMADVSYVRPYVDNRLGLMVRQRLEGQVIAGNGQAPNLEGLLTNSSVGSQAKGADPTPDAVYKAMTTCRVTGRAEPNLAVFHPNDWQDIRLLRTIDGVYIWGAPSDPGPARIWGLPVVQSTAETENTGLVGDFANYCDIAVREDVAFEVTDSHASLFIQRTLAILAYLRAAFTIYRPTAFCKVTGI